MIFASCAASAVREITICPLPVCTARTSTATSTRTTS
jgi:hypothetical protein